MNKKLTLLSLLLASTACVTHSAYAKLLDFKLDLIVAVSTCTGKNSNCSITINAIGDVVDVDVNDSLIVEFGKVTLDSVKNLSLPEIPGIHRIYSFIPSEGELAGTEIYLLVQNEEQRIGTRRAEKTVFTLSRLLADDKSTDWIKVGDIAVKKSDTLKVMPFLFEKDGTINTFEVKEPLEGVKKLDTDKPLPEGIEKVSFHLGAKDLTPQ